MKKNYRFETTEEDESIKKSNENDDDEEFEDLFDTGNVSKDDNRIYFYSEVTKSNVLKLNTTIRKVTNMMLNRANNLSQKDVGNIFLHVNSFGGSLFDGLLACDYIRNNKVPIHTVVDGTAASAASIITIVGKKRLIHKNSFMLIHQLSSMTQGSFHNLKDGMRNCEMLMKIIKDIYKQYTKIPSKKLEEILAHDLWFESKDCLRYGLVDSIID